MSARRAEELRQQLAQLRSHDPRTCEQCVAARGSEEVSRNGVA